MPHSFRILLIEDNQSEVRLIQESLKQIAVPCELDSFREGAAALEFASQSGNHPDSPRPDLIILDLNMPGMHGVEVLRRLKSNERTSSIPVIVFSSSSSAEDVHQCYALHANCYIQKPMDFDSTARVIQCIESFWGGTAQLPRTRQCASGSSSSEG